MRKSPRIETASLAFKRLLPLTTALAALIAAPSVNAAASNWNSTVTTGSWNTTDNWDNGIPNGSDAVANIAAGSATINTTIDASTWALSALTGTSSSGNNMEVYGSDAGTVLDLGSGGITLSSASGQIQLGGVWWQKSWSKLTINATADQTWTTNNTNGQNGGININAALTGNAVITLQATNPDWQSGVFSFDGGNSSGFTGSFVLKSGEVRLANNGSFAGGSQLARLGTNTMTWDNDVTHIDNYGTITTTALRLSLSASSNTAETFATPINFQHTGGASRYLSVWSTKGATGSSLALTGAWSGDLSNVGNYYAATYNSGTSAATIGAALVLQNENRSNSDGNTENQVLVRLTTDNSGLTATGKTGGSITTSALMFEEGAYSVENANSLGAGNALSVALGSNGTAGYTALLAQGGINIGSKIFLQGGGNGRVSTTKLGVLGTGTSTFSGDLYLGQGYSGNTNTSGAGVRLSASSGAVAAFTGNIQNGNTWDDVYATITAEGGGKIILAGVNNNSGFQSALNAVGATTLQIDGNTTGVSSAGRGSVTIGAAAATLSNAVVTGDGWKITGLTSTAGLVVGQAVTGTGIADGSTITQIGSNYIEISTRSTLPVTSGSTTNGSAVITGVDTTGLVVGFTVSGSNIPTGSTIVSIDSVNKTITLSQNATGTGGGVTLTTSTQENLSAAAETGILAGTGRIAPGTVTTASVVTQQSITIAAGSSIAPGDDGVGKLTLDGGSTTATLLTMANGSSFTFSLGLGGSSSQLDFWNYSTGDLSISGTATLNFTGTLAEGTYTLMSFYSNNGTTASNAGITSGLTLGTGLDGYTGSLAYSGSDVTLTLTAAVPEPATWAMIVGGLGLLAFGQRMRQRSA